MGFKFLGLIIAFNSRDHGIRLLFETETEMLEEQINYKIVIISKFMPFS